MFYKSNDHIENKSNEMSRVKHNITANIIDSLAYTIYRVNEYAKIVVLFYSNEIDHSAFSENTVDIIICE